MSSPTPNAHLIHFEIDEIVLQDVDGIIFEEVLNLWCGKDVSEATVKTPRRCVAGSARCQHQDDLQSRGRSLRRPAQSAVLRRRLVESMTTSYTETEKLKGLQRGGQSVAKGSAGQRSP